MSCGSSWGTLSSAACTIVAARSSERSSLSEPLKARPMGERAVATMTGSGLADSSDRRGVEGHGTGPVSYTHLRAHETVLDLVCRLLLEKKKEKTQENPH